MRRRRKTIKKREVIERSHTRREVMRKIIEKQEKIGGKDGRRWCGWRRRSSSWPA
jgi:hypothetical protein